MNQDDYWDRNWNTLSQRKHIQATRQEENSEMPDNHSTAGPHAYRCIAYKPEVGAEVTEEWVVAESAEAARDLFVIKLGSDKIKEGWTVKVFPPA